MADFDPKSIPILDDIIEDNVVEDDHIEKEKSEPSIEATDTDTDDGSDENNFDLFSSDATVTVDENQHAEQEHDEPQLGTIDNIIDQPHYPEAGVGSLDVTTEDIAEEETESALIDYRAEDEENSASNRVASTDPADDIAIADNIISGSTIDDELSDDAPSDPVISDSATSIHALPDPAISDPAISDLKLAANLSFTANTGRTSAEPAPAQPLTPLKPVIDEITDDIVRQLLPDLEQQLRFLVQQALEDRLSDDLVKQMNTEEKTPP